MTCEILLIYLDLIQILFNFLIIKAYYEIFKLKYKYKKCVFT